MQRPEAVVPPFPDLPSDPAILLATLSASLDQRDVRYMAEADRGRDADEHERQLRRIVAGEMASPMAWCPREVLQLVRWDEPNRDQGEAVFERRHRLRTFACAVLVRSYGEPCDAGDEGGREATALQLVGSLEVLEGASPELAGEAAALLAWAIPRLAPGDPHEHPFLGLAALWCALGAGFPDLVLRALADWVMAAEDAVAGRWRHSLGVGATGAWLLPLVEPRARQDRWRHVVLSLPARVSPHDGNLVRDVVRLMAAMMDE